MASDQLRRESVTEERDTMVEKDRVPKMATHYEHLSEKAKEAEQHISPRSHEKAHRQSEPSLEEISKLRATAQQNSIEAIRAAGEKAVAAKDAAAESGKGAAGYVGKVKDQAVVAGWGATQYTLEKVAEATKAVAGAGKTVVGYAEEKIAAAKDVVVANEEKAADFAARKKAEAQKASYHEDDKGDWGETIATKDQPEESFEEGEQQQGGSILQAIGQTIDEIGQTTKELLVGQFPIGLSERDDEAKFREEHHQYPGPGKTN